MKNEEVDMKGHLYSYKIDTSYEKWIWHGKTLPSIGSSHKRVRIEKLCDENKDDQLTNLINDAKNCFIHCPDELTKILEEGEKSIYSDRILQNYHF